MTISVTTSNTSSVLLTSPRGAGIPLSLDALLSAEPAALHPYQKSAIATPAQQDAIQQDAVQQENWRNLDSTSDYLRRRAARQAAANPPTLPVRASTTNSPHSLAALSFSALTLAQSKHETARDFLLQMEQQRTGKSAEEIERTVGQPIKTFLTELAAVYPPSKGSNTDYLRPPAELNTRLFILRALEEALNTADLASPIAYQKLHNTYSQHRNLIDNANNDVPNDMGAYTNMALESYLGEQATGLNAWIDWEKAKIQIHTPSQAVALMNGASPNGDLAQKVGRTLANASSERPGEIFSELSSDEKSTLDRAALLYYTARDPSFSAEGKDLPELRKNFANLLRETYQKSLIFFSPMDTEQASKQSEVVARLQTRGQTPDQLVDDPNLQSSVPGFSKLKREDQIRLVNERLIEQGQSTDPRYKMGSPEHAMASTLIQTLQMQGQAVPKDFGSKDELTKKFFDACKTWQTTPNSAVHPFVLFSLNLARASGEDKDVIGTGTDASQKIKNLINYGKERLFLFPQPARFDRKEAALAILQEKTGWSKEKLSTEKGLTFSGQLKSTRKTPLEHFLSLSDEKTFFHIFGLASMNLGREGTTINPMRELEFAERKYNEQLPKDPWIIARAKENIRARGQDVFPSVVGQENFLNDEIKKVVQSYATQTEVERRTQGSGGLLRLIEAIPILGQAVEFIDGLATKNIDKIFSPIPFIGGAYNFVQGIRQGDPGRAIGGSLQFGLDFVTSGEGGFGRTAEREVEGTVEGTVTRLETKQLPSRLAANLRASTTLAEALGEKIKINLPEVWMAGKSLETADPLAAQSLQPSAVFNVAKSAKEMSGELERKFAEMLRHSPGKTEMEWLHPVRNEKLTLTKTDAGELVLLKVGVGGPNTASVVDLETGRLTGALVYRESVGMPWARQELKGGAPLRLIVVDAGVHVDPVQLINEKGKEENVNRVGVKAVDAKDITPSLRKNLNSADAAYQDVQDTITKAGMGDRNAASASFDLSIQSPNVPLIKVEDTYQSVSGSGRILSKHPGTAAIEGKTHLTSTDQRFKKYDTTSTNGTGLHERKYDTELKLLEKIANRLDPRKIYTPQRPNGLGRGDAVISGDLVIRSRLPVCHACQAVISEFQRTFPNIKMYILVGDGKLPPSP